MFYNFGKNIFAHPNHALRLPAGFPLIKTILKKLKWGARYLAKEKKIKKLLRYNVTININTLSTPDSGAIIFTILVHGRCFLAHQEHKCMLWLLDL